MASPYVGVVLRHGAVDAVQLARGLGGMRLARSARVGLSHEAQRGSLTGQDPQTRAQDNAEVAEAIRKTLANAGIHAKRVAVAMPPDDVLLRAFTIPSLPHAELEGAVQFEARKYLPFKLSELVWDYQVTPRSDKQVTVIFTAVERASLLRVRDWVQRAGLVPVCIEPYSFSLARTVQSSRQGRISGAVAAVDVGEDASHIILMKDGLVYLARDVHFNHVEGSGAEASLSAAPLSAVPGTGQAGAAAAQAGSSSSSDPRAERLLSELRLSMEFFAREFAGTSVEQVVLFGDSPLVNRWSGEFAPQLGCPVEPGVLPVGQTQPAGGGTSLAAAVGVALGVARRGGASFDLLRRSAEAQPAGPPRGQQLEELLGRAKSLAASLNKPVLGVCTAAAVALLMLMWGVGAQQLLSERHRLALTIHSRPDVGYGLTGHSQEELEPAKQQLESQLAFLRSVMDDRAPVASKLDALARSLPGGIWLRGFAYQNEPAPTGQSQALLTLNGACFLRGEGQELSTIRQFEDALKHHATFFKGFSSSQMKEISAQADPQQRHTYRTFQLTYSAERRL